MKPFLAIDAGASNLKVALFEPQDNGTLILAHYEIVSLELRGLEEADRTDLLKEKLQDLFDRNEIRAKGMEANICAPSFQCFTKFLRTPAVEGSKVGQIVEYEAAAQVPFPLDEMEWGYEIMGTADTGELDVMLMALKEEVVESLTTACNDLGIRLSALDGAVAALRNAFMHNYAEVQGCSMLLDIGSKTTNVIFVEGDSFFVRSINFGANSITQEFAKESGLDWAQAEEYKKAYGYVHMTNMEEPADAYQAILVRTARNVMTRLHQQVSQTIQYYRSQQGGLAPQQIYLAGGGSSLIYTAEFFIEKFNLSVEFFNPFRNIEVGQDVEKQVLATNAHWLGELSGLGLRMTTVGLTEFNLLPKHERVSLQIQKRSMYVIATIFCAGLVFYAQAISNMKLASSSESAAGVIKDEFAQVSGLAGQISDGNIRLGKSKESSQKMQTALESRYYWINLINGIQGVLSKVEPGVYIVTGPNELAAATNRVDELVAQYEVENGAKPLNVTNVQTAVWIQSLGPTMPTLTTAGSGGSGGPGMGPGGPGMGSGGPGMGGGNPEPGMGGPPPGGGMGGPPPGGGMGSSSGGQAGAVSPDATIDTIYLKLKAKNIVNPRPRETLNREYVQLVEKLFRAHEMFSDSEDGTKVASAIPSIDSRERWFEFVLQLKLTSPIKMKDEGLE
tara:strand:+ start:386 stop:2407 length:2022 start_codon:yes stop_codon:yes gene_type:complete